MSRLPMVQAEMDTMLLADGRIVYQDDTKVVVNCDDNRFGNRLLLCLRKG